MSVRVLSLQIWWDVVLLYLLRELMINIRCLIPKANAASSFLGVVKCAMFIGHTLGLLEKNVLCSRFTR